MDHWCVPCAHCGAEHSCPESLAVAYAGLRVTRWCESCRQFFDVEFPRLSTLGDLLFGKPGPPATSESDWRLLVRAVAAGDPAALRALYARTNRIVFTLMLRTTHEGETAEALTLDTFYDVWRESWAYGAEEPSVVGWILNLARSHAIRRGRSRQRSRRPADAWASWPMDQLPPPSPELWDRLARRIVAHPISVPAPGPVALPDWQDAGSGISYSMLARNVERGYVGMLVRLEPGAAYPPHTHAGVEELYLLDGELWIDSKKVLPGGYNRAYASTSDERVWTETGCTCVLLTSTGDILR